MEHIAGSYKIGTQEYSAGIESMENKIIQNIGPTIKLEFVMHGEK